MHLQCFNWLPKDWQQQFLYLLLLYAVILAVSLSKWSQAVFTSRVGKFRSRWGRIIILAYGLNFLKSNQNVLPSRRSIQSLLQACGFVSLHCNTPCMYCAAARRRGFGFRAIFSAPRDFPASCRDDVTWSMVIAGGQPRARVVRGGLRTRPLRIQIHNGKVA